MPQLLMRSFPGTLLDQSCRAAVQPADRLRPEARRAVGHFGVGVRVHRSRGHLPVPGVRRAGPRSEARPGHRSGGGAVCDRARQPGVARRRRSRTSIGWPRRAWKGATGSTRRSTTTRATAASDEPTPGGARAAGGRARLFLASPGHVARRPRQRRLRGRVREPVPRRPARAGDRAPAAGAGAARGHPVGAAAGRDRHRAAVAAGLRVAAVPCRPRRTNVHTALPVERPLHRRGDQRRRRLQPVARSGGDAPARRPDLRRGRALHLPARSVVGAGVVGDAPCRCATRRSGSRPRSISTRSRSAGATAASRRSSTSPCRPKTTSRCGGSRSPTAASRPASSR